MGHFESTPAETTTYEPKKLEWSRVERMVPLSWVVDVLAAHKDIGQAIRDGFDCEPLDPRIGGVMERVSDVIALRYEKLPLPPTSRWTVGNEPKEEGEYLVTARWAAHSGPFVTIALWRDKEWLSEDGDEMEFVTHYAKINEVPND